MSTSTPTLTASASAQRSGVIIAGTASLICLAGLVMVEPVGQAFSLSLGLILSLWCALVLLGMLRGPQCITIRDGHIIIDDEDVGEPRNLRRVIGGWLLSTSSGLLQVVDYRFRGPRRAFHDAVLTAIGQRRAPVAMPADAALPSGLDEDLRPVWQQLISGGQLVAWTGPDRRRRRRGPGILAPVAVGVGVLTCGLHGPIGVTWLVIGFIALLARFSGQRVEPQSLLVHTGGLALGSKALSGEMAWDELTAIEPVKRSLLGWRGDRRPWPQALRIKTEDNAEIMIFDRCDVPLQVLRIWISVCSRAA